MIKNKKKETTFQTLTIAKLKKAYELEIKLLELDNVEHSRLINNCDCMFEDDNYESNIDTEYDEIISIKLTYIGALYQILKYLDTDFMIIEPNWDYDDFHHFTSTQLNDMYSDYQDELLSLHCSKYYKKPSALRFIENLRVSQFTLFINEDVINSYIKDDSMDLFKTVFHLGELHSFYSNGDKNLY
jgi:hypothetical protein